MQLWGEMRLSNGQAAPGAGMDDPSERPADVAAYWQQEGMQGIHVTDRDGAMERGRNWPHIEAAARTGLPVRFGGGIRHMTDIQHVLELGVRQVVVGTQAIDNPPWLAELSVIFPDRILAAIDIQQGRLVVQGRRRLAETDALTWARQAHEAGVSGFHYTELDEGRPGAPDAGLVRSLAELAPVTAVLGHAGPDALDVMREAGAASVLVPAEAPPETWRAEARTG